MNPDARSLSLPTKIASHWHERRTFTPDAVPEIATLVARKRAEGLRISVGIPALNEAPTIAEICRVIDRGLMGDIGLVDELVVLDGKSFDETAIRAQAAGARVVDVGTILPELSLTPGKGESLWRSLAHLSGDIIVWVDADIRNFTSHFVTRLVAPLLMDPTIDFVKAFYRRPLAVDGRLMPDGGGRVTELLARPMLNLLFPELAGFVQPLAGEYAVRADVVRRVPFFTGYSVEVGLLIDLLHEIGLDSMAQADLGSRVHRNRPLEELGPMAFAIARSIMRRAEELGRLRTLDVGAHLHPLLQFGFDGDIEPAHVFELERPPIDMTPDYIETLRAGSVSG